MTTAPYSFPPGLPHNLVWYTVRRRFRAGNPIGLFERLRATYGPIAHYRALRSHYVLIDDPELLRQVLVVQAENFVKERTQQRARLLLGNGLITNEGESHRTQRRLAQPAFYRQRIVHYAEEMVRRTERLAEEWEKRGETDVFEDMMRLALGITATTLFSAELDVEELGREVNAIMGLYNFLVLLPAAEQLVHYPLPGIVRFRQARARLDATIYRLIAERRASGAKLNDLLGMLLDARYEDGSGMSDEQLRDELITILLAGYETIANALTWTWYLLAQAPAAESRMHEELARVLGGRAPTVEDLPKLPYLEMVLYESMRMYPPAWIMGRRAKADFELGGYRLPAKTTVLMCQWVSHRNGEYFPEPERFEPERWTAERKASRPKLSYYPFGAGARQCIGESFAWMEAQLVMATLAQRFQLRLAPGQRARTEQLITLRPKGGMRMRVEQRALI